MIFISEREKAALTQYFRSPLEHIAPEHYSLLPGGVLPECTKIISGTFIINPADNQTLERIRYFIIPLDTQGNVRRVLVENSFADDPKQHSATLLANDLWVHQSRLDLEIDDNEFDENESIVSAGNQEAHDEEESINDNISDASSLKFEYTPQTKFRFYAKDSKHLDYRCVVKSVYALDRQEYGFIKSQSLAENVDTRRFLNIPGLHVGPEFFRRETTHLGVRLKKLSLTYDAGNDLLSFMAERNFQLSPDLTRRLALEILEQYLQQICARQIIHSDIKSLNICVKERANAAQPFRVTFIDFDEAFVDSSEDHGRHQYANGTPGFLGPEFFNTPADFDNQFLHPDQRAFLQTLIPEWRTQFTCASDIFALGTTILNSVFLLNGEYFPVERVFPPRAHTLGVDSLDPCLINIGFFAQQMTHSNPAARPTAEEIRHFVESEFDLSLLATLR